ncbi:DUF6036 family nucleotidyltransferase [Aequorivita capsosiphonis]|uniref:DUF6036 family nucleotidyltransferase n=1 Tax=Aequorivita capsosiphonis TaxID=487317 RepID=UPI00041A2D21|nr:DUF6036 family nucleotidyltransferase [Aequorivita capsosiphonis]
MKDLLEKICTKLDSQNIEYMISGSLALLAYTIPRMTRDIDIVINIQNKDVENFLGLFADNFYIEPATVREEVSRRGMFNIIDFKSGYNIDFIVRKNSEFNLHEFNRRKKQEIFGYETWIVSIEDLIISKLRWIQEVQSDTQINDIKYLLLNPNTD